MSRERIERRTRNVNNIHECDVRQERRNVVSFFSSLLSFSFVMVIMII